MFYVLLTGRENNFHIAGRTMEQNMFLICIMHTDSSRMHVLAIYHGNERQMDSYERETNSCMQMHISLNVFSIAPSNSNTYDQYIGWARDSNIGVWAKRLTFSNDFSITYRWLEIFEIEFLLQLCLCPIIIIHIMLQCRAGDKSL